MSTKVILLVDDDLDSRVIYRAVLTQAGYQMMEAADGEEGVRLAVDHRPDLVLMDLCMPVLDGWAAMDRLRADERTEEIPVCAISAQVLPPEAVERARTAGFVCFLAKPLGPLELLDEVEQWIGPGSPVFTETEPTPGS